MTSRDNNTETDPVDAIQLLAKLQMSTQKSLAAEAGISAQRLSRMLSQQVEIPESVIRALAAASEYPEEFFHTGYTEIPPVRLTYRHTSRTPIRKLNAISAEYSVLEKFVSHVWHKLDATWHTGWIDQIAPHTKIDPMSIDNIADQCRKMMDINPHGPVGNVINAAERSGIVVAPLSNFNNDDPKSHLNSDGVTYPAIPEFEAPAIGYAQDMPGDRLRFTVAHEIGHLILHRYYRPKSYRDMETEAHRFASAFLMPTDDAQKIIGKYTLLSDFQTLKARWGMSIAALISRGYTAGAYGKDRWRSLFMQLSARKWRYNEPVKVHSEQPILLGAMLNKLYGKDGLIDSDAIQIDCGVPISLVKIWTPGFKYLPRFIDLTSESL